MQLHHFNGHQGGPHLDPKVSKWTLKDVFKLVGFVSLTSRGGDLRLRRKSSKLLLKRLRLLLSKKSRDLMAQLNLSLAKFAKMWRKIDDMLSQAKNSEEKAKRAMVDAAVLLMH